MSNFSYPLERSDTTESIRYFFISAGSQDIVKAIEYSYLMSFTYPGYFNDRRVFNLAFGDYDFEAENINDSTHSMNGDVYKVFSTVLNTIPSFFSTFSDSILFISGSDSTQKFLDTCKDKCVKYCVDSESCKNKHRRINLYKKYVDKNYNILSNDYVFLGGIRTGDVINAEPYVSEKEYDSVFVFKK